MNGLNLRREPLAVRTALTAAVAAVVHVLVLLNVVDLDPAAEKALVMAIDLVAGLVIILTVRPKVTPVADPLLTARQINAATIAPYEGEKSSGPNDMEAYPILHPDARITVVYDKTDRGRVLDDLDGNPITGENPYVDPHAPILSTARRVDPEPRDDGYPDSLIPELRNPMAEYARSHPEQDSTPPPAGYKPAHRAEDSQ